MVNRSNKSFNTVPLLKSPSLTFRILNITILPFVGSSDQDQNTQAERPYLGSILFNMEILYFLQKHNNEIANSSELKILSKLYLSQTCSCLYESAVLKVFQKQRGKRRNSL